MKWPPLSSLTKQMNCHILSNSQSSEWCQQERLKVLWPKSVRNVVILTLYQHLISRNANQLFYPSPLAWLTYHSNQHNYLCATVKEAMIKLKRKKNNPDFEDYPNFRPISNVKVVTKIIIILKRQYLVSWVITYVIIVIFEKPQG